MPDLLAVPAKEAPPLMPSQPAVTQRTLLLLLVVAVQAAALVHLSRGRWSVHAAHLRTGRACGCNRAEALTAPPHAAQPLPAGDTNASVALCLIVKEDPCDINEWILHHARLGVGKVYVFDTGSQPPMRGVLADYIGSGLVEYFYLEAPKEHKAQNVSVDSSAGRITMKLGIVGAWQGFFWQKAVYDACTRHFGARHSWMGFIDTDEFVLLDPSMPDLPSLLRLYEHGDIGGLVLHWQFFSTGGHINRPAGGVLQNYVACCPRDQPGHAHVKSFVRPERVAFNPNAHFFIYHSPYFAVDTEGQPASGPMPANITYHRARLGHYFTRSVADYQKKMERGGGDESHKPPTMMLGVEADCTECCTDAVAAGRALAERWDLTRSTPPQCRPPRSSATSVPARGAPSGGAGTTPA